MDWADRNSCILFGDGAGAVVLEATASEAESGILGFAMHSDGTGQGDLNLQFTKDEAQSPPSIAGACSARMMARRDSSDVSRQWGLSFVFGRH